jgi:hypothetical protein
MAEMNAATPTLFWSASVTILLHCRRLSRRPSGWAGGAWLVGSSPARYASGEFEAKLPDQEKPCEDHDSTVELCVA